MHYQRKAPMRPPREEEPRPRSPVQCQCSCHNEGRARSRDRSQRESYEEENSNDHNDRRDDYDDGKDDYYDRKDDKKHDFYDDKDHDRYNRDDDDRNRRDNYDTKGSYNDESKTSMPTINVRETKKYTSHKGSYSRSQPNKSKYQTRTGSTGSKTSHLSVTSVTSEGKRRDRPPFRYSGPLRRHRSTGDLLEKKWEATPLSSAVSRNSERNEYPHEDFLTGHYITEYKARYDMRHGQRYKIDPKDNSIHFLDPLGEHVLVPKNPPQRRSSDSYLFAKNKNNVKLDPLDIKKSAEAKGGAAPKQWKPTAEKVDDSGSLRSTQKTLPPLEKSTKTTKTPHPLGLSSPPRRRAQLRPMNS